MQFVAGRRYAGGPSPRPDRFADPDSETLLVVLALNAALANCDDLSADALVAAVDDAYAEYETLSIDAFKEDVARTRRALDCLDNPITKRQSARIYRLFGLASFVDSEPEAAQEWFQAARVLEPRHKFPPSLVPEGNPVYKHYNARGVEGLTEVPLPRIAGGDLRANGEMNAWPSGVPVIVQRFSRDGAVAETRVLGANEAFPWEALPEFAYQSAPMLSFGAGTFVYDGFDSPPLQGFVQGAIGIPVGPVVLDGALGLGLTQMDFPNGAGDLETDTLVLPVVRLGAKVPFLKGTVRPHVGAAVLGTYHTNDIEPFPIRVGGVGLLGLVADLNESSFLMLDASAGIDAGLVVSAVAGAGVRL